jgi:hypothetical protein
MTDGGFMNRDSKVGLESFSAEFGFIRAVAYVVLACTFAMLSTGIASAQVVLQTGPVYLSGPEADANARPDTEVIAEQYLLVGSPTRGCGESQVAVNPVNPNEIAVSAMCQQNQNEGKFEQNEREFERTTRATITEFAFTRDRGLTWTVMEDPMRAYFHRYRCLDPFAAFAIDGTMILGCEAHFSENHGPEEEINQVTGGDTEDFGGSSLIWSTDGGRTFGDPVQIISSYMPKEILGPFVSYAQVGSQGDRPQIRVDLSTGHIYVNGNSTASDPPHRQTTFRVSKDRGRDWGMVYAVDSPEWPGAGGGYDVANGIMGTAYTATSVPASLNAKCPCRVFGASRDDGKTFARNLIPGPPPQGAGPGGDMIVAANPTKTGEFSVFISTPGGILSYLTDDSGKTWTQTPTVSGPSQTTTAMLTAAYSPKGILALTWRALYPLAQPTAQTPGRGPGQTGPPSQWTAPRIFHDLPQQFEIWSAISRDGGKTFSAPHKVSTAISPGVSRRRSMSNLGSDFISVAVDNDFVHMTWFDDRAGFRATWYGRVPISDYK